MDGGQLAGVLTGGAAGLAGGIYIVRTVVRSVRRLGRFLDDWFGEPARGGSTADPDYVPARPGVLTRLNRIERRLTVVEAHAKTASSAAAELKHNGGDTLKDQVTRIEQATGATPM